MEEPIVEGLSNSFGRPRVAEVALPKSVKSGHLGSAKVRRMSDNVS